MGTTTTLLMGSTGFQGKRLVVTVHCIEISLVWFRSSEGCCQVLSVLTISACVAELGHVDRRVPLLGCAPPAVPHTLQPGA